MPLRHLPRIVGFEVPPLKDAVDVVRDAPVVGLLNVMPSREWLDAFVNEAASTRNSLTDALVSVEGGRVLFFASASDVRTRCTAVRTMVEEVSKQVVTGSARRREPRPESTPDMRPRQVLVVEDDEVLLEVTCDMLKVTGWVPTPASNVAQAMAALEAQVFDAVLSDIDLAVRAEGLELALSVRTRWPKTGVVVVTGRHTEGALAVPEGVLFLAKPYQRRQLLAMLDLATGAAPAPR
ncbi:response regulator [Luteibacter aegosomatissinici]|uniref:response regulator n=1 Tax=Luteibacter aegosomatissinici TaxID=2911539 RepID=UPI001FF751A2|nr:response regulator [Luteibacter aegosomatissinici]UPG92772.1 response regulator [Luteibacter aegosomatissinici]